MPPDVESRKRLSSVVRDERLQKVRLKQRKEETQCFDTKSLVSALRFCYSARIPSGSGSALYVV